MVLGNETAYHLGQFGFFGKGEAFSDVAGDYAGALDLVKGIVRIDSVLVFGVECRILDFAYVM